MIATAPGYLHPIWRIIIASAHMGEENTPQTQINNLLADPAKLLDAREVLIWTTQSQ